MFQLTMSESGGGKKTKKKAIDIGASDLRLIELELNRHYDELLKPLVDGGLSPAYLLSCQMRRLQMPVLTLAHCLGNSTQATASTSEWQKPPT